MRLKFGSAMLAVVLYTTGGSAQTFTYPSFDLNVTSTAGFFDLSTLASQPPAATTYTGITLSFGWTAGGGDPYSNEALFALTNAPSLSAPIFHIDPGPLPGSGDNGNPTTLSYTGFLDTPYTGGNPLYFANLQTFGGSNAAWSSISLSLTNNTVTPPAAESVSLGGSLNTTLAAGEVKWYKFEVTTSGSYTFDTLGSVLLADNDTEIGLYNAAGDLVATNDDIDFNGENYLSAITATLEPGEYYLAAGAYNTTFGVGFNAVSTSEYTGSLVVNGISPVPEPGFLIAAGVAAAGVTRFRRKRK